MKRVAKAVLPKAARPGTSNGTSSPNQEHPKERHQKKNPKNPGHPKYTPATPKLTPVKGRALALSSGSKFSN